MTTKTKRVDSEVHEALNTLFNENNADVNKNQDYKDNFKEFELPKKYFLMEMYTKQKELQQFLANKGKTKSFPSKINLSRQVDIQTAIYHLFCMQIELQELKVELDKIRDYTIENSQSAPEELVISARYELIDMFFFMFNVGIYSGLDILEVVNYIEYNDQEFEPVEDSTTELNKSIEYLLNYIDKLPWKAWKDYDYDNFYNSITPLDRQTIIGYYAKAVSSMVTWAKIKFDETDQSLFNLYMNKWLENKRRQEDPESGYILNTNISQN